MPTKDVLWVFTADAEGLTDQGLSGMTFAWDGSDGWDGAASTPGCVKFTAGAASTEYGQRSTPQSYESMGIPVGAVVTSAQLISAQWKAAAISGSGSAGGLDVNLVTPAGVGICSNLQQITSIVLAGGWNALASGLVQAIGAAYQASYTDIRLQLGGTLSSGGPCSLDLRVDTVIIRFTYTVGGGSGGCGPETTGASHALVYSATRTRPWIGGPILYTPCPKPQPVVVLRPIRPVMLFRRSRHLGQRVADVGSGSIGSGDYCLYAEVLRDAVQGQIADDGVQAEVLTDAMRAQLDC